MFKNLVITSFLGLSTVVLGAFAAHALKEILTLEGLQSFKTAVTYQMYHVIILLFINTYGGFSNQDKNWISYFLVAGILFFSGSIYLIQLTTITAKSIWFVTPLGGLFFCIGWVLMIVKFIKKIIKK